MEVWRICLLVTLGLIFLIFAILILAKVVVKLKYGAKCTSNKKLDGKTIIVTGGTAGMGLEISTEFVRRGAKVIIACPFQEEGENGLKTIIEKTRSKNVTFKLLNLASLASVRKFAKDILATEDRLDILVNNAGVLAPDKDTEDGLNFIMQVNYFGHFLLTLLLLPLIMKSGKPSEPSRIVNVSSLSHAQHGKLNLEKLNNPNEYRLNVYMRSKVCVSMFSRELSKKLTGSDVVINTADPGVIATTILVKFVQYVLNKGDGISMWAISKLLAYVFLTPWEGAQSVLHLSLDQKAEEVSGEYFRNCQKSRAGENVYDHTISKKLWEKTIELVKLSDSELNRCFPSM